MNINSFSLLLDYIGRIAAHIIAEEANTDNVIYSDSELAGGIRLSNSYDKPEEIPLQMKLYHNFMIDCEEIMYYNENDMCAICMEALKERVVNKLGCGHLFHNKCYSCLVFNSLAKKIKVKCPLCREEIKATTYIL